MLASLLLLSLYAAPAGCPTASALPQMRTPATDLDVSGAAHHRLLVIDQDFHPNADYEIALDSWVGCSGKLAGVRMWWIDTAKNGERSPFGKSVRRYIDIAYDELNSQHWTVKIRQGRKDFAFEVLLPPGGVPLVYGNVAEGESVVEHCRVESSRLVSRKILGVPTGLKRLEVRCVDQDNRVHRGVLRPSAH